LKYKFYSKSAAKVIAESVAKSYYKQCCQWGHDRLTVWSY
jgi:hypothetical protein